MRMHHTFMGVTIWRNMERGSRLRWYAIGVGASDTLEGMRRLIREDRL
jgi:cysteine synthase